MKTIRYKTILVLIALAFVFFLIFFFAYLWQVKFYNPWDIYLPFLIITLSPIVSIVFILTNSPVYNPFATNDQNKTAKGMFFICLFFFLLLQGYGIYYYKLRLQLDGAADMFFYSALPPEQLPVAPYYRFAYLLNKLLLKPCFQLHLPITVIARIYCVSDACFYLVIAGAIIVFTRRYDYAAVVLAAPVLIAGMNFYFIGTELFLSGAVMILYTTVYRYPEDGYLKNLILFICLFFIVWSHPLMLVVMGVFMASIYSSRKQLENDRWLLAFVLANMILRVLLLSEYDQTKLVVLNATPDFGYWVYTCKHYLKEFWYVAFIGVLGLYVVVEQKSASSYKGFIVLPVLLYYCNAGRLSVTDPYFTKFFYPLHLLLLMQVTLHAVDHYSSFKKTIWVISAIMLFGGVYNLIARYHFELVQRVVLMEKLNTLCNKEDPQQSKWFVREDSLRNLDWGAKHYESISFSAYQNLSTAIQVVRGNTTTKKYLSFLRMDEFSVDEKITSSTKVLNPYYYHFKDGYYKELMLDSTKLEFLRAGIK